MRTVVWTGSRGWEDVDIVIEAVQTFKRPFRSILGGADGLDSIAEEVVAEFKMPRLVFKPKWRVNGKYNARAGHERNWLMLDWLQRIDPQGFVIAGWDGESTGTKGCMDEAERRGIDVWRIQHRGGK